MSNAVIRSYPCLAAYWQRKCGDKRQYRTPEHASRVADIMTSVHGAQFSEYKCFNCGRWHVGHTKKEVRQ